MYCTMGLGISTVMYRARAYSTGISGYRFLTWWRNQQIRVFQARRLLLALVLRLHEFVIAFVKTLDSKSTVGRQFAGGYPILLLSTSNVEASHVRSSSKPS